MLCDPASRPVSPFHRGPHGPHAHAHAHQPLFPHTAHTHMPMPMPNSALRPAFHPTYSTPALQPTCQPIPAVPISTSTSMPSSPFGYSDADANAHALPTPSLTLTNEASASSSRPPGSGFSPFSASHSTKLYRPKALKKPSASTSQKQRNVQLSLEVKVEKAKGFHAFFVPLCKNMPPAPPCSPVLGHSHGHGHGPPTNQKNGEAKDVDYFGQWAKGENELWVEDVDVDVGMGIARTGAAGAGAGAAGDAMELDLSQ